MGLDIVAIEGEIVDLESGKLMSEMGLSTREMRANLDFPNHYKELEPYSDESGVFMISNVSEPQRYSLGSYSGYNKFRKFLCQEANGIDQTVLWDLGEAGYDLDFGHLINFSDCEGVIGPNLCKKLYNDFVKWESKILTKLHVSQDMVMYDRYIKLKEAFEIGSKGIVIFT